MIKLNNKERYVEKQLAKMNNIANNIEARICNDNAFHIRANRQNAKFLKSFLKVKSVRGRGKRECGRYQCSLPLKLADTYHIYLGA